MKKKATKVLITRMMHFEEGLGSMSFGQAMRGRKVHVIKLGDVQDKITREGKFSKHFGLGKEEQVKERKLGK